MKKVLITPKKNLPTFNANVGKRHMIFRSPSPVDDFYRTTYKVAHCKREVHQFSNPLQMLLNQERLNRLGQMGLEAWLSQFNNPQSPLAELRKKCSDQDLASMIKSRHIQSHAEILAWARYMKQNMDKFNDEVKQLIEAQQSEPNSESNPEPNS